MRVANRILDTVRRRAELLIDKTIDGCRYAVGGARSLGLTLNRWRERILVRHSTGAVNGSTEDLDLLVKKLTRAGHGVRSVANCRLRILLYAGGVSWIDRRLPTPHIRIRDPPECHEEGLGR